MKAFGSLFLSLLLWMPLRAQFINDGGNIDRERYNFGFSLALNYGSFDVVKRGNYQDAFEYEDINGNLETVESLAAIRSIGKPGFSLGLLANLNLHRNFDLRFTPNIIFVDRDVEFKYWQPGGDTDNTEAVMEDQRLNIRFTNMQFPLLLKFKSNRQGNIDRKSTRLNSSH